MANNEEKLSKALKGEALREVPPKKDDGTTLKKIIKKAKEKS